MNLVAAAGVEPANDLPYESDLVPTSPQKLGAGPWNRTTLIPLYQSGAHPESMTDMEPSARVELASRLYKSRASPAMLRGPRIWSRRSESNARQSPTVRRLFH